MERQLTSLATVDAALLAEAREAEAAWNRAPREEAEDAYGDYQLVVDAVGDRLLDLRESYAATLPAETADTYRAAFSRTAQRRFRAYAAILAD